MNTEQEAIADFRRGERIGSIRKVHKCYWCGKTGNASGDTTVHEDDSQRTFLGYACDDDSKCLTHEQKCAKADSL